MDEGQRGWSWMGVLVVCCAALCSASYSHALNADQCAFFAIEGKTQICHATNSATNPYVHIEVSRSACVNGHSQHASDYIAANEPACDGSGCLPEGAPVDSLGVVWNSSTDWESCAHTPRALHRSPDHAAHSVLPSAAGRGSGSRSRCRSGPAGPRCIALCAPRSNSPAWRTASAPAAICGRAWPTPRRPAFS